VAPYAFLLEGLLSLGLMAFVFEYLDITLSLLNCIESELEGRVQVPYLLSVKSSLQRIDEITHVRLWMLEQSSKC
jgi:hypothetical protein